MKISNENYDFDDGTFSDNCGHPYDTANGETLYTTKISPTIISQRQLAGRSNAPFKSFK